MTSLDYYRRAVWLPIVVPAVALVVSATARFIAGQALDDFAPILTSDAILVVGGVGALAYAPFAVILAWWLRERRPARVIRLVVWAVPAAMAALMIVLHGAGRVVEGYLLPFHVSLMVSMTLLCGYAYVAAIELGMFILRRKGRLQYT